MATATAKKPRVDTEAVSQLSALPERVGIVETKVESIKEQISDLKADVKEMHDCLDNTRDLLADKLEKMQEEYRANSGKYFEHADKLHAEDQEAHSKLAGRIGEIEKLKNKYTMYAMVALAFAAGTGWLNATSFPHVLKFLGL
jgi:predicted RNase H-like nuclease (RuvC/YqgF family)